MPFRRRESAKDLDLPTLIDVVFLLLIFFLVTYSSVPPRDGHATQELKLPVAEGAARVNQNELLETMLIEIVPVNPKQPQLGYQVSVLWPFEALGTEREMPVTYQQAKNFAQRSQRLAALPVNYTSLSKVEFEDLPAVRLISAQLDQYVSRKFRIARATNRIEIRAETGVTFRIINFIIEKTSSYGDLVPSLVFRTMYQKEQ